MLKLDVMVARMPRPEFINVSPNLRIALTFSESQPTAFTINWQWVLAEISKALITADTKLVVKLLFSDLDYGQLNHNAVEDLRSLVRQSIGLIKPPPSQCEQRSSYGKTWQQHPVLWG